MSTPISTEEVLIPKKNLALILAVQRAEKAETVIIRRYTDKLFRVLDAEYNPLVNIKHEDLAFLTGKGILKDLGRDNLYRFNKEAKYKTA